ncbi:M56 family metallopeptidase [Shewanella sp.]|uniref:M56 family metallopeptidase n=1 Tax=Shewanella sp. TaxID=50422 RepID=UPI003564B243
MLVGNLAITLNLLSIAVLACAISILFITMVSGFILPRLENAAFGIRRLNLWALVTAPWWIAVCCVVLFWPSTQQSLPIQWLNEFAHWHHIDIFSFSSWHSVTLIAASLYLFWGLVKALYVRHRQSSNLVNLLELSSIVSKKTQSQKQYYSLPVSVPAAFTAGLLSPRIYLTTALCQLVSEQELDIIVRHEQAHVAAYDPLLRVVFAFFAGFFPTSTKHKLIGQFTLLTEQVADHAVTDVYDSLDIAQTLINVARMQRPVTDSEDRLHASYFGNDHTTIRVKLLINPVFISSRLTTGLSLALFGTVLLLTASSVDSFHHIIETLFTH